MITAKSKILCVDDEPDLLGIYSEILRSAGYEVLEASTGNECSGIASGSQLMAHSKKDVSHELSAMNHEHDRNIIEISVIGIKAAEPKLFREFTQLESAYEKKYEGTGLGLALTKRLVDLHGGKIWVESEFGKRSNTNKTGARGKKVKTEQYLVYSEKWDLRGE